LRERKEAQEMDYGVEAMKVVPGNEKMKGYFMK
jgi:hypothetical protein